MICSDARRAANRMNSLKSTGPKTEEGKAISRRNGLKHGLSGEGVVVPEGEAEEIARRVEALEADMKPRSPAGVILIGRMASLSVRMERAGRQESVALAMRVRHAVDDFDEERVDEAERLFDTLHEEPRKNLRKLKKSPEGVDLLIEKWRDLRDDLTRDIRRCWTAEHLERAAHMTGLRGEKARDSRLGALSRGIWGDFDLLSDREGGDLGEEARQAWAKARLVERIDAEIAGLEAHRETLDLEMIEVDRLEAPGRALFDPSKQATLARRYEAEASRGFFKALREFRQVEAEFESRAAGRPGPEPAPTPGPAPSPEVESLASPWEAPDPRPGESFEAYRERAIRLDDAARKADGRLLSVARGGNDAR